MPELSLGQLQRLESALNENPYRGLPLASALNDLLITEVLFQRRERRRLHWRLGPLVESFHRKAGAYVEVELLRPCEGSCHYLVAWTASTGRFWESIHSVLRQLRASHTAVSVVGQHETAALPVETGVLINETGRFRPGAGWKEEYGRRRHSWLATFERFREEGTLDRATIARLLDGLCLQSQRTEVWIRVLGILAPRVIVTDYDRSLRNSCLVLAARRLGIPSLTMVHGVITREYGYTPVLADKVLCWGEMQEELLVELGTASERVIPVGFPSALDMQGIDGRQERADLDLPPGDAAVLLATNPIRRDWKLELVDTFGRAFPPGSGICPVVRLHPAEELEEYDPVARRHPHLRLRSARGWPAESALATFDVVVCHNSGFAVETLLANKPLVLLDAVPLDLGSNRDLAEKMEVPVARAARQLREIVLDAVGGSGTDKACLSSRNLDALFTATGDDAVENIVRQITLAAGD